MVENLQREDLDFVEEAQGHLENLIRMFDMSQEEAARRRLGLSQSAVANKLRLLKLPPDILAALRDKGLTERHGRALLRLGTSGGTARRISPPICDQGLNVAQTDAYIDALLTAQKGRGKAGPPPGLHPQGRAGVPQHPDPQPRPHEAGRNRRRDEEAGDRGRAHCDHLDTEKISAKGGATPRILPLRLN